MLAKRERRKVKRYNLLYWNSKDRKKQAVQENIELRRCKVKISAGSECKNIIYIRVNFRKPGDSGASSQA